jgi:hypothetical protein
VRVLDVPLPVLVTRKDGVHGLEWHSLVLGQEASDEDGHGDHPCSIEEEYGVLEVVEQGEEDLGLHREDEVTDNVMACATDLMSMSSQPPCILSHSRIPNEFSTSLHLRLL